MLQHPREADQGAAEVGLWCLRGAVDQQSVEAGLPLAVWLYGTVQGGLGVPS